MILLLKCALRAFGRVVFDDAGVWVLDNEDQHVNLRAIVERGNDALSGAKFIKRE
jgi:hypothetical protein